jgi:inward rectifier potassium channel
MASSPNVHIVDTGFQGAVVRTIGLRSRPLQDFYHFLLGRTWSQIFAIAAAAFVLFNALFALVYLLQPGSIDHARPGSFEDAFYFSVQTMATIGYGVLSPATRFAHLVVLVEALFGIFQTALITGIVFSKFSRPTARVLFADRFVLLRRDGVPHVAFRMANARHNLLTEAHVRLTVLVIDTTREGEVNRRAIELPLVRDHTPLFALSFLALHKVDEASPFRDLEALRAVKPLVILTVSGLDQTFGQQIHARHVYRLDDIVENARFKDVLTSHDDGTYTMDYTNFNEIMALS